MSGDRRLRALVWTTAAAAFLVGGYVGARLAVDGYLVPVPGLWEWSTIWTGVAALGTLVAVGISLYLIDQQQRDKRAQWREAIRAKVLGVVARVDDVGGGSADQEWWTVSYGIEALNDTDHVVHNVSATLDLLAHFEDIHPDSLTTFTTTAPLIRGRDSHQARVNFKVRRLADRPVNHELRLTLEFTDDEGHRWRRNDDLSLEML